VSAWSFFSTGIWRKEVGEVLERSHNFFSYSPHPYIFFNHDHDSMTFLGFLLDENGDLLDPRTFKVLQSRLMGHTLRAQLIHQGVDFDVNYEIRDRFACDILFYISFIVVYVIYIIVIYIIMSCPSLTDALQWSSLPYLT
jgi:hypothetical protein